MDKHSLLMLFDYHFGMYDQVWECVMDLTTDRFNEESDYSLGVVNVMDSVTNPVAVPKYWTGKSRISKRGGPTSLEAELCAFA